ncbi:cell wall-binding repeat-containing protein [Ornithinimicrobium sufpigmenti]|uniref:cell wall-binding repeat-containing protein n=1 Tax=Ornithinimicrobium sufpigmenti TaxID=2508882 RepID=UPI0015E1A842|nr:MULTISPECIES: cell wall-binding repeat-containing protein [unclassified Ornithinimicrobium]
MASSTTSLPAAGAPVATSPASPAEDAVTTGRIAGADRYQTAAEIARAFPAEAADTVIIATGRTFPDALSSAVPAPVAEAITHGTSSAEVLMAQMQVPVLLTRPGSLPGPTASALRDLAPSNIIVMGGSEAVSASVLTELQGYADQVVRVAGANRYATSAAIVDGYPEGVPVLFVATGDDFPDALTGGAVAGRDGMPLLLTDPDRLRGVTAEAITRLAPQSIVVLGGSGALSDERVAELAELVPDTTRVFGPDRYGTAAALTETYQFDTEAYLASGHDYPDALTGGALAAYHGQPLLLTRPAEVPGATTAALDRISPEGLTVFGGPVAVSDAVTGSLDALLPAWADEMVLQMLSFNDYHGHISVDEGARLSPEHDPEQHAVGGAVNLATTLEMLRVRAFEGKTITVAAGDLIGGSTFVSGLFQDEPAVETLNVAGLDVSSVGNHEFDEGVDELLRMQDGGCHPVLGCFIEDEPYQGADFQWLAANVVDKETREPVLPATEVREVDGVDVGFIGMTLEDTPSLVSPGGVATVDFLDEVETANAQAAALQAEGVESIVVLLHEGGYQTGTYNGCEGISGPIVEIAEQLDPAIDAVVTGHTHEPYVCSIPDPDGNDRLVTSANQYARVVTETALVISRSTGDVVRDSTWADNRLVLQSVPDHPVVAEVVAKWEALADVVAGTVVGTIAEDITGDAGGDRGIETPMANVVADSILWGTSAPEDGGAQISFMNVGGVRASLVYDQISNEEEPGEVTYQEAYNVMPFGNILVSIDLTGADIKAVLEQQYVPGRGREYLALGVSEGFTYTWDDAQPEGSKVGTMELNGEPIDLEETYRVSTLNFLAEGGDDFTAFTNGTNLLGGPEDLANLVGYLGENPGLTAPEDRRQEVTPEP